MRGLSISADVLCDYVFTVSGICARGSLNYRAATYAIKWALIGIMLARVCTRACCNSERVVSASTANAVTTVRGGAAEQMLCVLLDGNAASICRVSPTARGPEIKTEPHCGTGSVSARRRNKILIGAASNDAARSKKVYRKS